MGLEHRPYVGTWRLDNQSLVQHTPDALVYLNGDVSIPGCPKCNGRIDIQQFLTEVSVDSGTQMNSASATFTLSIPLHHTDSFARDAKFILRPGLEAHIYERGYFPVKGLYANFVEPRAKQIAPGEGPAADKLLATDPGVPLPVMNADPTKRKVTLKGLHKNPRRGKPTQVIVHTSGNSSVSTTIVTLQAKGLSTNYLTSTSGGSYMLYDPAKYATVHTPFEGANARSVGLEIAWSGGGQEGAFYAPWSATRSKVVELQAQGIPGHVNVPAGAKKVHSYKPPGEAQLEGAWKMAAKAAREAGGISFPAVSGNTYSLSSGIAGTTGIVAHAHYGGHVDGVFEVLYMALRYRGYGSTAARALAINALTGAKSGSTVQIPPPNPGQVNIPDDPKMDPKTGDDFVHDVAVVRFDKKTGTWKQNVREAVLKRLGLDAAGNPLGGSDSTAEDNDVSDHDHDDYDVTESGAAEEQVELSESGIENLLAYPYYQVFHGVVTSVSHAWSAGVNTVTVQCASMLHFWQYQNISANASFLGARATNSGNQMSLQGHNFTGWHPYQIMYTLHYEMVGAAGGIAWALSEMTNQEAKSEIAGEQMFSMQLRYWQQRFSTSMIQLRMHGASGSLFSAAQAAFLATTSTTDLTNAIESKFADGLGMSTPGLGILEQARSVGLFRKRKNDALTTQVTVGSQGRDAPSFEVNMIEMQAFAQNLGNMGQVNLFESTYATKANIADVVCNLTGFEFYQDVDGDFVFKPPMYNLDTSASQVYRIEDIDIISINFDEKEPEATYLTGKNAFFQNFEGTGVENEWGVRGQYIDFRLVAQFGWRPGPDFETSYLNDPRAMFFAAANRLDVLNAPCNSATVSIPLRPELRPGYPVYIPYLDAFYYCQSFQHSYSNGGQCTTNLQLIAKRAKFYAPGTRGAGAKQGIDSIDLSRSELPERPLTVHDSMGVPRLSGFPNVVMALDPKGTNPMFRVVGSDTAQIQNPETLRSLLATGVEMGLVHRDSESGLISIDVPAGTPGFTGTATLERVYFYLQGDAGTGDRPMPGDSRTVSAGGPVLGSQEDPIDVTAALSAVNIHGKGAPGDQATNNPLLRKIQELKAAIRTVDAEVFTTLVEIAKAPLPEVPGGTTPLREKLKATLADLNKQLNGYSSDEILTPTGVTTKFEKLVTGKDAAERVLSAVPYLLGLKKRLADLEAKLEAAKTSYEKTLGEDTQTGVNHLKYLINRIRAGIRKQNPYYADINSTVNLLDMLSDKKASYMAGSQPGAYRYYSASHPDVSQQGQDAITYTSGGVVTTPTPLPQPTRVLGFYPRGTHQPENAVVPEAQMGMIDVKQGIKVMTSDPSAPDGEVLPTNEIWELMFTAQSAILTRKVQDNAQPTVVADWTPAVKKGVIAQFSLTSSDPVWTTDPATLGAATIKGIYESRWKTQTKNLQAAEAQAITALKAEFPAQTPPALTMPVFPSTFQVPKSEGPLKVDVQLGKYKFSDNSAGSLKWAEDAETVAMGDAANDAGIDIGLQFFLAAQRERGLWSAALSGSYVSAAGLASDPAKILITKALSVFNMNLSIGWGVDTASEVSRKTTGTYEVRETLFSPVFPVSDAKGYHVVGSQRYGRGIDIETGNVFFGMHAQDPLSLLDREIIEEILNFFVRNTATATINIPEYDSNGQQKKGPDGNPVFTTVTGSGEVIEKALNRKAAGSLRRNLTDAQIIDLFGEGSSAPTTLDNFLRNFISNKGKDGLQKIPAINAAKALSDLTLHTDRRVCSCKSAETEVLLEGLANGAFLSTPAPGTEIPKALTSQRPDNISQWVAAVSALSAESWKQSQNTLRGLGNSPK